MPVANMNLPGICAWVAIMVANFTDGRQQLLRTLHTSGTVAEGNGDSFRRREADGASNKYRATRRICYSGDGTKRRRLACLCTADERSDAYRVLSRGGSVDRAGGSKRGVRACGAVGRKAPRGVELGRRNCPV